ncbi:hypothetical protein HDU67_002836, partial [Dinochytrium kinnereticum]
MFQMTVSPAPIVDAEVEWRKMVRVRMYSPSFDDDEDPVEVVVKDVGVLSGGVFGVKVSVPTSLPILRGGLVEAEIVPSRFCRDSVHPFGECGGGWKSGRIVGVVEPVEVSVDASGLEVTVTLSGPIQPSSSSSLLELFKVSVLQKPSGGKTTPLLEDRSFVGAGSGGGVVEDAEDCFLPGTGVKVLRVEVEEDGRRYRVFVEGVVDVVGGEKKGSWWGWGGKKSDEEEGGVLFVAVGEGQGVAGVEGGDSDDGEDDGYNEEGKGDAVSCRPFAVDLDEFLVNLHKPRAPSTRRPPRSVPPTTSTHSDLPTPTTPPSSSSDTPVPPPPIVEPWTILFKSAIDWLVRIVRRAVGVAVIVG